MVFLWCFCGVLVLFTTFCLIFGLSVSHMPGNHIMLYQKADNGKMSGRADGNVYMRNGRVRGMTVPALVRNAYTAIARSNFSNGSSSAWAALTDDQRQSWNDATGHTTTDRFGNVIPIKGKELYVQCYANCKLCGTTVPATYPDLLKPPALESLSGTASVAGTSNSLVFTPTPLAAHLNAIIYAVAPKRATIYRPSQSLYRLITTFVPTTASPVDIYANYNAKYSVPLAGQRIFARVIIIDDRSGFASAKVDCNYIVGA